MRRDIVVSVLSCIVGLVIGWALQANLAANEANNADATHEMPAEFNLYGEIETDPRLGSIPFELIVFDRSGCFGTCPSYRLELSRTGRASYNGRHFVEHEGIFEGEISPRAFALLAIAADRLGVLDMEESSGPPDIDGASTTITLVERESGRQHAVTRYSVQSPEFWLLAGFLDSLSRSIKWRALTPGS